MLANVEFEGRPEGEDSEGEGVFGGDCRDGTSKRITMSGVSVSVNL